MLLSRKGTKILEPINVRGRAGEKWTLGDYVVKQKEAGELLQFGVAQVSDVQCSRPVRYTSEHV